MVKIKKAYKKERFKRASAKDFAKSCIKKDIQNREGEDCRIDSADSLI